MHQTVMDSISDLSVLRQQMMKGLMATIPGWMISVGEWSPVWIVCPKCTNLSNYSSNWKIKFGKIMSTRNDKKCHNMRISGKHLTSLELRAINKH